MKYEWRALRGWHYLIDESGRILAEVRRTNTGTYKAFYAGVLEDYIDLDSARSGVLRHIEEEKAKQATKKEKGDGKNP